MSADTHTSAPLSGASAYGSTGRAGRAGILPDERPSGALAIPSPNSPDTGPLSWNQDSSTVSDLGRRQPRMRQLMAVCSWAAVLGALGLAVGFRALLADLLDEIPRWYELSMVAVGIVGIGLTVGAFVTVHRRHMPYFLLGAATLDLAYAMILTATAL